MTDIYARLIVGWLDFLVAGWEIMKAKRIDVTGPYRADSTLLESGLLGPVVVSQVSAVERP